jgi:hypothetical protein
MHFRYKRVNRPDGTTVKTPSLPVTLIGEKETVETVALLDSGADISAIPKEMAEILGFDLSGEIQLAHGIGGTARTIEKRINVRVGKGHENYTLNIPIKIVLDKYDFPPLLGRAGFFKEFTITFMQGRERLSLKKFSKR